MSSQLNEDDIATHEPDTPSSSLIRKPSLSQSDTEICGLLESILEDEELHDLHQTSPHHESHKTSSNASNALSTASLSPPSRQHIHHRKQLRATNSSTEITTILNAISEEAQLGDDSDEYTHCTRSTLDTPHLEPTYSSFNPYSRTLDSSFLTESKEESSMLSADIEEESERRLFLENNYKRIEKMRDTLQGELIKAEVLWNAKLPKPPWSGLTGTLLRDKRAVKQSKSKPVISKGNDSNEKASETKRQFVTIKKTSKELYAKKIGYLRGEDITFCIEEDALKEEEVLKCLTVDHSHRIEDNKCHVVKYIDAFESESYYYLVTEYIANEYTLTDFVHDGLEHVDHGRLKREEYLKIIRYLFWQLSVWIICLCYDS